MNPTFLADEDFDNDVLRGLLRRAELDIIRAQDVGLSGLPDGDVLDCAARNGRVLLTHDIRTLVPLAYARVAEGRPMPGVFAVRQRAPIGAVIEDILLFAQCGLDGEYEGRVIRIPT